MSDNYRKDSKEYCRREEKSTPLSGAYIRASTFALPDFGRQLRAAPRSRWGENGKSMRLASYIDGSIGSAGSKAAQPCFMSRGSI